ncbi:MAG: hypothetical protein PHQ17_04390 [Methanobacterium sp.]|nr:hypothetical protein [Methanobacterium sp.]
MIINLTLLIMIYKINYFPVRCTLNTIPIFFGGEWSVSFIGVKMVHQEQNVKMVHQEQGVKMAYQGTRR